MTRLSLSFSEVSRILQRVHKVIPDRASAFEARLKHYQKQGFPSGINTGRGRAAEYSADHLMRLAVATEFNQVGLSPDRTISLIESNIDLIQTAFRMASRSILAGDQLPTYLYFDPSNLYDLTADNEGDSADNTFGYAGLGLLHETIDDWTTDTVRRRALIHISALIDALGWALERFTPYSSGDLVAAIVVWE